MMRWTNWLWAVMAASLIGGCGGGGGDAAHATQPQAARIDIDQSGLLLPGLGRTAQLTATAVDAAGSAVSVAVTWSSSRPDVVAIDVAGQVSAQSNVGSAQITARAGPLTSPPLLVVISTPAAGVTLLSDAQMIGLPDDTDPGAVPSRRNTYQFELATDVALPEVGVRLLGTGSKPLAGEVVSVNSGTRRVTMRLTPMRELLPNLAVNEVIDLSQVEPIFPEALLAAYTVTRVGDRYDFTPKAVATTGLSARERPAAVSGTSAQAIFPFDRCSASLTGVPQDGNAPLPLALSMPPAFSFSLPATLEVVNTPANGLERAILHARPTFAMSAGLKLTAAINGSLACKVTIAELPIPVTGALSWIVGGVVSVGVGTELSGNVTLATMGIDITSTTSAKLDLGVACAADECRSVHQLSDFTNDTKPKIDLPSVGDFRVELAPGIFGFADLEFGTTRTFRLAPGVVNRILRSLRIQVANAKISAKVKASVAPRLSQVIDETYQSNYKFVIDAKAGLGQSTDPVFGDASATHLEEIASILGVAAVTGLEVSTSVDLARSPTGTATVDRKAFRGGEALKFRATLNDVNQLLSGAYNVGRVLLVRAVPGGTEVVGRLDAVDGQRDFEFTFVPSGPGTTDEFFIFVTTRALNFALLESLELFPFEVGKVTGPIVQVAMNPLSANVAPGGTQSFVATVTGTPLTDVTWSSSAGSITTNGMFTAPGQSATVQVVATSVADPTVNATATVLVGAAAGQVTGTITVAFDRSMSSLVIHPADLIEGGYTNKTRSATSERAGGVASFQVADVGDSFNVLATTFSGSAIRHDEATSESEFHGCYTMDGSTDDAQASAVLAGGGGSLVIASDGTYVLDWGADMLLDGSKTTVLRSVSARVTNECIRAEGDNSSTRVSNASFTLAAAQCKVQGMGGVVTGNSLTGSATCTLDLSDPNIGQTGQETVTISWDLTRN